MCYNNGVIKPLEMSTVGLIPSLSGGEITSQNTQQCLQDSSESTSLCTSNYLLAESLVQDWNDECVGLTGC